MVKYYSGTFPEKMKRGWMSFLDKHIPLHKIQKEVYYIEGGQEFTKWVVKERIGFFTYRRAGVGFSKKHAEDITNSLRRNMERR